MRKAFADIRWISYSEGGRKTLPQLGAMYYPHILVDQITESQSWSVCFLITPVSHDSISRITFSMLIENEETSRFFSKLCVGMEFKLLEGDTIVAIGQIKGII